MDSGIQNQFEQMDMISSAIKAFKMQYGFSFQSKRVGKGIKNIFNLHWLCWPAPKKQTGWCGLAKSSQNE